MSELGTILKNARIEKGITLDQLEEMTKIRKRYLTAIEEQKYDVLPGSFYVRAFIKNYAENVGLNPDDILEMYKNELPQSTAASGIESMPSNRKVRSSLNFEKWGRWASAIIMVSFFLLIVGLIYYYMIHNDTPESRVADQTPLTNNTEVIGNAGDSLNDPSPGQDTGNNQADSHSNEEDDEQPDSNSSNEELEDEPFQPEVVLTNSEWSTDVYTVTAEDQLEVSVEVTDQICWVTVKEDHVNGNILYSALMTSAEDDGNDQIQTWTSDSSLYIVLGRASDVTVTVNGVELEPFEVATVRNLQLNFVNADEPTAENI